MISTFATGFGLGFVVAAAVGPISLLCIRTVLSGATASGIAIGAGAAVIDGTYALLGSLGAAAVLKITAFDIAVGVLGCIFLAWLGARTLWSAFRVRMGAERLDEVARPRRAFLTSLGATASNPSTILSWAAVFAATSTAGGGTIVYLVAGVFVGTLTWFTFLSVALALVRGHIGDGALTIVDLASAIALLCFTGVLGYQTVEDA